ncbi:MAG TPA: YraN family protein [Dehalococcoidia bacterium]|nr:YraN family protein [Dehalococcoidia bacterium]
MRALGSRRALGAFGERVAAAHLEAKGYVILDRNYRRRDCEIDLIAEKDGVVAFVEVKTRRGASMGTAIEGISETKVQRLLRGVERYGYEHPGLAPDRRIDIIAIDLAPDGRVLSVEHIEGAVVR